MADGTIYIDTRIDPKGMNNGTKSIGKSLGGVMSAVKKVAIAIGLAFSGAFIANFVRDAIQAFDYMSSFAGQSITKIKSAWSELQGAAANLGLVLITALAPYVIMVVTWLTQMLSVVTQIIAALFGVDTAMAGVGDTTKDTAKKAQGSLAAFDQINVLAKPEDKQGAPGLPPVTVPPDLLAGVEEFKQKILEFFKPLTDAFDRLVVALTPLGMTIWAGLKWAWDNIFQPLGEWVANDLLPAFLDLLGAAGNVLNQALIALQPIWQWFWDNVLKPAAEWTGQVIIDALTFLTAKLNELAAWIRENPEQFQTFVLVIAALAAAWWLANAAVTAWAVISGIGAAATLVFGAAMAFLTSPVVLVFLAIVALIAIIWALIKYWPQISAAAITAWNWIVATWNKAAAWFTVSVTEPVKNTFAQLWETIKQLAYIAWNWIPFVWGVAAAWFKTNVTDKISGAFSIMGDSIKEKWETVFQGIKDFAKSIINGIIGFINLLISSITSGINALIIGANAIGSVVPDWINIPTVAAPQIPYLAKGAVIPPNSQFLAMLGDQRNGTNIEAPADLIRQIVREEVGSMQTDVKVTFGGSMGELIRILKPQLDRETRRVGGSLIMGGTL